MSNPPPWNDPIKPPNGNFSLEERKWREGITRGLNNIKIKSLGDIGDVDLTSPSANEILKFDGSNWVNGTPSTTVVNWGDIVGSLSNQTDLQNALNAKADLLSLATVATSGSYNDLSDKPTIPTVNDATLTIQKNSSNVGTFTANASSNVTVDISVPTDTNDLTNGAGYITSSSLPTVNDATLTIQKNGTNVATFTANASSNATANISVPTDTSDLTNTAGYITGISSINDIGDVTITTPSTGELLKYDGSKWINGSPSTSVTNWGDILGALSNQTDLQNALNDKQDVIDANNKLDYSLLSNTPTIPTVNDATLTLKQNGTTKGTFTANASSAVSIDFTDTNTTSGITVNSNVVPDTDSAYLLGDTLHYWYWLYVNRISVSNVVDSVKGIRFGSNVLCTIQPYDSETGLIFRTRTTDNTGYKYIIMDNEDFYPSTGNSTDLGKNGRWRTIYTNNAVNVSDVRAKDNIEDLENALEKINSIGVKSYTLNNHDEGIMYGFIAQDELERNPELVVVPNDYSEEEGGGELMYMPNNVLFLAVKAIQELSAKVTALENKLESLGV